MSVINSIFLDFVNKQTFLYYTVRENAHNERQFLESFTINTTIVSRMRQINVIQKSFISIASNWPVEIQ